MKLKFKVNAIVRKKQIILAALVLCLSLAVYLNWVYSDNNIGLPVTNKLDAAKNYGDAAYVSQTDEEGDAFLPRQSYPAKSQGMKRWQP